jgi:hypothetical protein
MKTCSCFQKQPVFLFVCFIRQLASSMRVWCMQICDDILRKETADIQGCIKVWVTDRSSLGGCHEELDPYRGGGLRFSQLSTNHPPIHAQRHNTKIWTKVQTKFTSPWQTWKAVRALFHLVWWKRRTVAPALCLSWWLCFYFGTERFRAVLLFLLQLAVVAVIKILQRAYLTNLSSWHGCRLCLRSSSSSASASAVLDRSSHLVRWNIM